MYRPYLLATMHSVGLWDRQTDRRHYNANSRLYWVQYDRLKSVYIWWRYHHHHHHLFAIYLLWIYMLYIVQSEESCSNLTTGAPACVSVCIQLVTWRTLRSWTWAPSGCVSKSFCLTPTRNSHVLFRPLSLIPSSIKVGVSKLLVLR